ncbi:MAG: stage V sporulation protein AE [Acetobacteraceae bacterium]|nr:stage V sporulation protein AE [Acetobacteraceae bacterium]
MDYVWAFVVGGGLCVVAQLLLDLTPDALTPAHVMVIFVSLGALLSGLGLYQPLVDLAHAGATVPLPGFGHALVQGILKEAGREGWLGLVTGGLKATALGLTAAILVGYVVALLFNPRG